MERNFTNENFEHFLQRNADHLRMRPNDKVWKNISKGLEKGNRRMVGLASIMLLTSLLLTLALDKTPERKQSGSIDLNASVTEKINNIQKVPDVSSTHATVKKTIRFRSQRNIFSAPSLVSLRQPDVITADQNDDEKISSDTETTTSVPAATSVETPVTDAYVPAENKTSSITEPELTASLTDLPLTIESVTNSYKKLRKNKLTSHFFFTPTISYRKLSENKSYMRSLLPQGGGQHLETDIQDSVTHKPNIGFEAGLAFKYPLSNHLKLRGGVQFNMNRYDIRAYHYTTEIATIALNEGNRVDSVVKATNYRNQNGFRTYWLQNFYFQVSTPIGVEYMVNNSGNRQFGFATTIQPTYVIGDRAYLISTDYKNYAQVPSLIRRWNVATSFEAFMSYSTGHLNWQVGPQVRYQLLSSFVDKYPVKENLFDFGLKVGVSLNNNK